jgi:hypothetical protein
MPNKARRNRMRVWDMEFLAKAIQALQLDSVALVWGPARRKWRPLDLANLAVPVFRKLGQIPNHR